MENLSAEYAGKFEEVAAAIEGVRARQQRLARQTKLVRALDKPGSGALVTVLYCALFSPETCLWQRLLQNLSQMSR